MKQETLKSYLLRDKGFLKELFESSNILNNARILSNRNDTELNTFIYYCHFVAKGDIHITKKNFEAIKNAKKLHILKSNVETIKGTLKLINGERIKKIQFIKKLNNILPNLLYGLFNLT